MTAGGVVSIHAIGRMAGVGTTAFAVHAAHHLADRFPGGQIFLLLNGHTPGQLLWQHDGPWADAIARHTAAIQAARHLDAQLNQANALSDLGDVRRLAGDYPAAAQAQAEALLAEVDALAGPRLAQ